MKIFTDEFKAWARWTLPDLIAAILIAAIIIAVIGFVGGVEQGLIWRV